MRAKWPEVVHPVHIRCWELDRLWLRPTMGSERVDLDTAVHGTGKPVEIGDGREGGRERGPKQKGGI